MLLALALLAFQSDPKVAMRLAAANRRQKLWTASVYVPQLASPSGKALSNSINREGKKAMAAWIAGVKDSLKTYRPNHEMNYESKPLTAYEKGRLASVKQMIFDDTGGAHPNYGYALYNFWDGKPAKLADFFSPGFDAARNVEYLLVERLVKDSRAMWLQDGTVHEISPTQLEHFTVTPKGLVWTFGPYELGPYVVGTIEQTLTAAELGPNFRASMLDGK